MMHVMSTQHEIDGSSQGAIGSADIKRMAAALGFELCGVTTAAPIERGDFLREWLGRGFAGTMGYLHRHQESRIDVRKWLLWARSVIVVALNYKQKEPVPAEDRAHGRIAMYAWGEDYHQVMRERLEALVMEMRKKAGGLLQAEICVDTSAVLEREFAARAGIGWIGKNTLVLNSNLGSMFFLGLIITDLDLSPNAPATDHCGTCTRCLDACPTDAFPQPFVMDARRCISYLTIENRGEIAPELAAQLEDWIFGCDVCQSVCPFNSRSPQTTEPRFRAKEVSDAFIDPATIAQWNDQEYSAFVKGKATDRATLPMWKRNACIVSQAGAGKSSPTN
jgi:epoxyqueuosine reductase